MPQPFRVFGLMMMVYPEPQGLQGQGDDDDGGDDVNEESGNSCHSELPSSLCKSSHSTDNNQTEDLGEPTQFSPAPEDSCMVKDEQVGSARHALELEEEDQKFQEPFCKEMGMSDNLAGEEEPSPTHHLPGCQRLPTLQRAGTAPKGSHDSFQHSPGQHLGTEAASQAQASDHYVGHAESTTGAETQVLPEEDSEDRESLALQLSYNSLWQESNILRSENETLRSVNFMFMSENFALRQAFKELRKDSTVCMEDTVLREEYDVLREEYDVLREQYYRLEGENAALRKDNALVRRTFNTFQNNLKRQACMVVSLQDQLKASQAEREREAREVHSLVQQTQCQLQLMAQRALDAETNVERLKQKIFILQGQLDRCKQENENLRTDRLGSSEVQLRIHQAKPPRAHNGQRWLPQAASASGMLPAVSEVLESTRKILKF